MDEIIRPQLELRRFSSREEFEKQLRELATPGIEKREPGSTYMPSPTLNQVRAKQRKARKHAKARARRMARR